ncbi:MAG: hypothetical protein HPY71_06545 [Firmicutes bacterium]|nr:hypothetical protein [Bacillota bacterium]
MEEAVDWKAVALDEMETSIARGSSVREACLSACDRLRSRFGIDRRPSTLLSFYYKARKERSQNDENDSAQVDVEITTAPCDAHSQAGDLVVEGKGRSPGEKVDSPALALVRSLEVGAGPGPLEGLEGRGVLAGDEGILMKDTMAGQAMLNEETLMEFFTRVGRSLAELIKLRGEFEQSNARTLALERENEALRRENEELARKNSEMTERLILIQKTLGG